MLPNIALFMKSVVFFRKIALFSGKLQLFKVKNCRKTGQKKIIDIYEKCNFPEKKHFFLKSAISF
jgi:hypothetical protein